MRQRNVLVTATIGAASLLKPIGATPARESVVDDSFLEVVYTLRHGNWKL